MKILDGIFTLIWALFLTTPTDVALFDTFWVPVNILSSVD